MKPADLTREDIRTQLTRLDWLLNQQTVDEWRVARVRSEIARLTALATAQDVAAAMVERMRRAA